MSGGAGVVESVDAKTAEALKEMMKTTGDRILQIPDAELKGIKIDKYNRRVGFFNETYGLSLKYIALQQN